MRTLAVVVALAGGVAASEDWKDLSSSEVAEWFGGDIPAAPAISVDGKNTASAGELVRLDAVADPSVAVLWHLVGGSADHWDTSNDGRTVFFASPQPGRYVFILAASASLAPGVAPDLQLVEHVLTISGPAPGPVPPGPAPGPTPPGPAPTPPRPVLPQGQFAISQAIYDAVATMPPADKALICDVASNYSVVASQCAAGTIPTFKGALEKAVELNRPRFGARRDDHVKAWGNLLNQRIGQLSQGGKLPTSAQWSVLFDEIALGLRAWGAN
jgi:hypothetical protein